MPLINRKKIVQIIPFVLLSFVFCMTPTLSYGALTGFVPCDGGLAGKCDFVAFITMVNNIINWFISISTIIFAISCVYGGFLYLTSGTNPGNKAKAKSILWSTAVGFVIILTAWVIVYTIIHYIVDPSQESSILRFLKN